MIYIKYDSWLFEVDERNNTCLRQISFYGGKWHTSNVKDHVAHFFLTDQPMEREPKDILITKEEFESRWNELNKSIGQIWNDLKSKFPLKKTVDLTSECCYPQGVLASNSNNEIFICPYENLRENFPQDNVCSRLRFRGKVIGYDESNFWIKVHPESPNS